MSSGKGEFADDELQVNEESVEDLEPTQEQSEGVAGGIGLACSESEQQCVSKNIEC
jgi:hypothetical protein